ncbi:hypothetical protein FQR65_LT07913 [Abscondita terminalis]|nr:hypothetical protein FQR65_LT07913 [Abscondita terminalis]
MSEFKEDQQNSVELVQEKLNNLRIFKDKREINILLLGEVGVGKSTFINAFVNYFTSFTLQNALNDKLQVAIPVQFTTFDDNYEERVVEVSKDCDDNIEVDTTGDCSSCVCSVQGTDLNIRLIDTPGFGDPRGIDQDKINFDGVLNILVNLICIKQLLSKLDKSAINNIIFVFTHTRGTSYRPGETFPALRHLLSNINEVVVPCEKNNIFCTDNEAFKFLALKNEGLHSLTNIDEFNQSWTQSFEECLRMITYIAGDTDHIGLIPHKIKNTIAINKSGRLILQLLAQTKTIFYLIREDRYELHSYQMKLQQISTTLNPNCFFRKNWQTTLNTMLNIANRLSTLEKERDFIIKTAAKFMCFLKTNTVSYCDDFFESHLEHLINDVHTGHEVTDFEISEQLVCMLSQYIEEKRQAMDGMLQANDIKADDIFYLINSLHCLEISGPKIKEIN